MRENSQPNTGFKKYSFFIQQFFASRKTGLAHCVKNNIVNLRGLGEVLLCVVNDMVGSESPHHFQVSGTAYSGNFCAKILSDLHSGRTYTPGRTIE